MGVTYHHYFLQGLVDRLADMTKRAQVTDAHDYAMVHAPDTQYMREYAATAGNNSRINALRRQNVVDDAYIKWIRGEYAKGRRPSDYEKQMARRIAESHAIGGRDVARLEQASPYLVNNEALRGASAGVALRQQQERDWRAWDTKQYRKLEDDRFAERQESADALGVERGDITRRAVAEMKRRPVLSAKPTVPAAKAPAAPAPAAQTSLPGDFNLSLAQFNAIRANPQRARLFTDPGKRQELLHRAPDLVRQYDAMARSIPETPEARANREAAAQASGVLAAGRIPARTDARQHPGDMLPATAKAGLKAGDTDGDSRYSAWLAAQPEQGKQLSSADKMYARQYFKDYASGMMQKWRDPDISRRMQATGATIGLEDLKAPVAAAPVAPVAPAAPAAKPQPATPRPAPASPAPALADAPQFKTTYDVKRPVFAGANVAPAASPVLPSGDQVRPAAPKRTGASASWATSSTPTAAPAAATTPPVKPAAPAAPASPAQKPPAAPKAP